MLAALGPYEEQVRYVRARDQQDDRHGAQEHPQDVPDVSNVVLLQRIQVGTPLPILEHGWCDRGNLLRPDWDHPLHIGMSLFDRGVGQQSGDGLIDV